MREVVRVTAAMFDSSQERILPEFSVTARIEAAEAAHRRRLRIDACARKHNKYGTPGPRCPVCGECAPRPARAEV